MRVADQKALKELQKIPGIGPSIAKDLYHQGFRSPSELYGQDPEKLYQRQCKIQGARLDPCLLYTFRCAVYFVEHEQHDPELLKWWNWKDRAYERSA